jgi:hypothetical protein
MVIETRKTHTGAVAASLVLDQKVVANPLHPHLARTIADCLEGIQPSSIKAIEAVTGITCAEIAPVKKIRRGWNQHKTLDQQPAANAATLDFRLCRADGALDVRNCAASFSDMIMRDAKLRHRDHALEAEWIKVAFGSHLVEGSNTCLGRHYRCAQLLDPIQEVVDQ